MRVLEILVAFIYCAFGFRYTFSIAYAEQITKKLKLTKKEYNNNEGRWEENKVYNTAEGNWEDVTRAFGYAFLFMPVWPIVALAYTGERGRQQIASHNAHKIATTITMTKKNPRVQRIDSELKTIRIKQLEREVGLLPRDEGPTK